MINNKIITVTMPAYNAEQTLEKTFLEIPFDVVDNVIITDDCSRDNTVKVANKLAEKSQANVFVICHNKNKGYGGNQKSSYKKALEIGSDIVIMVHPDYQYTPKLIHSIVYAIADDIFPVMFASRILGEGALKGGMPLIKYLSNRILTLTQNIFLNRKLSEYHTGYRAYSAEVLRSVNYESLSDDFVFDNQIIAQIISKGYAIGEVTCPTKYFPEASSINLKRSAVYGFGVLKVSFMYRLHKWHLCNYKILQ